MAEEKFNALFICTGNSARSIMAEVLMNHLGKGRFSAYSAGSHPTGVVNPLALKTLENMHLAAEGLRSKSWDEFSRPDSPIMDFVFTVCDRAAGETCPLWPGQPMTAHWGVPDPAAVEGSAEQKAQAFRESAVALKRRIELMLSLPLAKLDRMSLQKAVSEIGKS